MVAPALAAPNQEVSQGSYDVIVYIDGDQILAEDRNGQLISSGAAGTDDSSVIQTAVKAIRNGTVVLQAGDYKLADSTEIRVSNPEEEDPSDEQKFYKEHAVPGRINFVDFDFGGEGVAYHDTLAGNQGGHAYRTDDADVDVGERSGVDVPVISNTYAGEWIQFSGVQVTETGTYAATFYTSTTEDGMSFSVLVDGKKVATVDAPNTGDWHTFAPTTVQIPLTTGGHTVQIAMETGWVDMAYVELAAEAPTPTPTPTPTVTPTPRPTVTPTPTPPPTDSYDIVVYIDGTRVVAEDQSGKVISSATAGRNDGEVIQNAIDALNSGTILVKAGTYVLSGQTCDVSGSRGNICIYKDGIHLKGEGDATVLKQVTNNDEYAIVFYGQNGDRVKGSSASNLLVEMGTDRDDAGYGAVWFWNADNCQVDGINVKNLAGWVESCIAWEGIYFLNADYNTVTNCAFDGIGGGAGVIPWHEGNALNLQNSHHNIFDGITITHCIYGIQVGYEGWGSSTYAGNSNTFSNIRIDGSQNGVYIRSGSSNNQFTEVEIRNSKTNGVLIDSGSSNAFTGCIFQNNARNMRDSGSNTIIRDCQGL